MDCASEMLTSDVNSFVPEYHRKCSLPREYSLAVMFKWIMQLAYLRFVLAQKKMFILVSFIVNKVYSDHQTAPTGKSDQCILYLHRTEWDFSPANEILATRLQLAASPTYIWPIVRILKELCACQVNYDCSIVISFNGFQTESESVLNSFSNYLHLNYTVVMVRTGTNRKRPALTHSALNIHRKLWYLRTIIN